MATMSDGELLRQLTHTLGVEAATTLMGRLPPEGVRPATHDDIADLGARIDARFGSSGARVDARFESIDTHFGSLEARMDARFGSIDAHFESLEARMDARFESIDARFESLEGRMDARFGSIGARFGSLEGRMDARFESLEGRMSAGFDRLEARIGEAKNDMLAASRGELIDAVTSQTRTMIRTMAGTVVALMGFTLAMERLAG